MRARYCSSRAHRFFIRIPLSGLMVVGATSALLWSCAAPAPKTAETQTQRPADEVPAGLDASLDQFVDGGTAEDNDPLLNEVARAAADDDNMDSERTPALPDDAATRRPRPSAEIVWNTPSANPSDVSDPLPVEEDDAMLHANAETEASTQDTNRPAITPPSRAQLMVNLATELHHAAADSDTPLREYLALAAMTLVEPQRRIDPNTLYDLRSEEDREVLGAAQEFFIELGRLTGDGASREELLKVIDDLRETLADAPALSIPTFKLTRSVQSFGDYVEFETDGFLRGRSHEMIAYVEVDDFKPIQTAQGAWRTRLAMKVELYTAADGLLVYSQPEAIADDVARRPRRDFFLVRHLTLPPNLSLGKYHLKVRVRDEATGGVAEAVLPIRIVASGELAWR